MRKTTILLTVLFFFSLLPSAQAQLDFMNKYVDVGQTAAEWTDLPEDLTLEEAVDYIRMLYPTAGGLHQNFTAKGANCNSFIKPNGQYGQYGQVINSAFDKHKYLQNLLEDDAATARGMQTLCPNFASMDQAERRKFWVWAFAAVAWDESTCLPGARAKGSTTTAVGLLQMEAPWAVRKWRGGLCQTYKDVSAPRENLLCGMEIMSAHFDAEYQVAKKGCTGEKARGLILSCSYWQKLRDIRSAPARLISLFPACGASRGKGT